MSIDLSINVINDLSTSFLNIFQEVSKLQLDHKAHGVQRVQKKQGTVHVPNLCYEFMEGRVMHPVSTTNVYMSLAVAKYCFLINNHARFQNKHGEEMSATKKITTQYVQVMLALCLNVYIRILTHLLFSFVVC